MLKAFTVFGVASALYAVSRLLLYYASNNEFRGKPETLLDRILGIAALLIGIYSIPAAIVFTYINNLFSNRARKQIEKECDQKWYEIYNYRPCPHCGQPRAQRPAEDWEDTFDDDDDDSL